MTKEDRVAYENYIYHKRAARGDFETALGEAMEEERKNFEDKLQEKENIIQKKDKELQEKDNKHKKELQAIAKLLLENGFSKEQIFAKTGIKL